METFFKRVIVSYKKETTEMSELDKLAESTKLKRFTVESVAVDCEDYIKSLVGEEVVLGDAPGMKIDEDKEKVYYLVNQASIAFK